ncbi:MAG: 4'-phosphopantetheinyl transferase superfamily protein [Faecalibacterium sp.]|nr:4'-phosphopantetheinyl transferase superfamily protein [Ruminococcus sp.]MCM1392031.1 4'-phosphopantetheinyl transferase superfamily protein [Ruminococcus sp.]MCM1484838.1 4'-phosphopantetheinyl transferase superfamily protein [Faecalibacterium sp.]
MKIYYAHIDSFDDDFYNKALTLIPKEKRLSAENISHQQTKKESILAWYIVSSLYRKENAKIERLPKIEYHANGKPLFSESGFYFNISHSDGFVCVAVADSEIGLDVQIIKPSSDNLRKKVLSIGELSAVRESDDPDELFIDIWTRKESFLKFTGAGISCELNTLDFSPYLNETNFMYNGLCYKCIKMGEFRISICSDKYQNIDFLEFFNDIFDL